MRFIMMGTGPFAVPTFEHLLDSGHSVPLLVTRPTSPARGRRKAPVNPMRDLAEQRGVPIFAPDDVNAPEHQHALREQAAELMVVCDYGQILSAETLSACPLGGINLHGSLLPKYRGAAPVNWAVFNGDPVTGVTVIHMTPRLDAGPCLTTREVRIGENESAAELEPRLAAIGVEAVADAVEMLLAWDGESVMGTVQDQQQATRAPRLKRTDGRVDWARSAEQIRNQIRAFKPWPGTFTSLPRPGKPEPLRLILDAASVATASESSLDAPIPGTAAPGTAARCDAHALWIATGDGFLSIDRLQPAGKRVMDVSEFLRGHPLTPGTRFE